MMTPEDIERLEYEASSVTSTQNILTLPDEEFEDALHQMISIPGAVRENVLNRINTMKFGYESAMRKFLRLTQ